MNNEEIIREAESYLHPHTVDGRLLGDVACTLLTNTGRPFSGVCIDTGSGTGFCAEANAIGAMVTSGNYRMSKIVAVWRDSDNKLHVVPPCGRCREFMRQIDESNLNADIVLGKDRSVKLRDLLPYSDWPK